jgi:ATP-binding cassette subfamily B protein
LLSKETASDEEVEEAIKLAAFDKDIPFLSKGLHTLVGEKGVALSGGQKQRLSIARALLRNPQILILDDSLSAVDAKTEEQIIRNLTKKRQGKTTFIITHRLSAVEHADHILVLEDGRIVQEGTHKELKQREGWYREQHIRQYLKEESEVKG